MKSAYNPIRARKPKGKRGYSPKQEISLVPKPPRHIEMYLDEKAILDACLTAEVFPIVDPTPIESDDDI